MGDPFDSAQTLLATEIDKIPGTPDSISETIAFQESGKCVCQSNNGASDPTQPGFNPARGSFAEIVEFIAVCKCTNSGLDGTNQLRDIL